MTRYLTLAEAARQAGMPPSSLRSWATRLRKREVNPIELWADRDKWIDGRTPVIDEDWFNAVLQLRPGRGGSWDDVPVNDSRGDTETGSEEQ
jgi:hypothetical protein